MAKVVVEPVALELMDRVPREAIEAESIPPTVLIGNGFENPAFSDGQVLSPKLNDEIVKTTQLMGNGEKLKSANEGDEDSDDGFNEGFEKLDSNGNKLGLFIYRFRDKLVTILKQQKKWGAYLLKIVFVIGFFIYFGFAMSKQFGTPAFPIRGNIFSGNSGFALFFLVAFALFVIAWERFIRSLLERLFTRLSNRAGNNSRWSNIYRQISRFFWIWHVLVFVAVALYVGLTVKRGRNFVSLAGIIILVFLGTLGSKYPHRIRWKTVFYSFVLQFILAVIVIRLDVGYQVFNFLGQEISSFINNAEAGAEFVYGDTYEDHFFAFKITSIIIFLGSFINVLYYLGVMQFVICKIAWLMQHCLSTTAAESMNAAANIFVGMTEAPLLIMPLIPTMTNSELHAVLLGGFATMAGSVLATFIAFGVPADHIIAASVMAAPGALGFAKLLLPETHKSKTTWETVKNVPLPEQHNIIDALITGAANTLKVCGYLIANLIAFLSVLKFLDVTISWLFDLVHHPEVNFQYLLGLVFYPFAIIVGIPLRDCLVSSKLIGIKISLNEFIAYQELGKIRTLRDQLIQNNTFQAYLNGSIQLPSGTQMLWDDSSPVILTYALCGFANFGSMGISLAALSVFAPARKRALISIAPRALIGGNMVSLMTASIAGLLYDARATATTISNSTLI